VADAAGAGVTADAAAGVEQVLERVLEPGQAQVAAQPRLAQEQALALAREEALGPEQVLLRETLPAQFLVLFFRCGRFTRWPGAAPRTFAIAPAASIARISSSLGIVRVEPRRNPVSPPSNAERLAS